MAKFIYTKLNAEPIEIEYVEDEHDSEKDFEPSFWFENSRHYLNDFMRTHHNPWCGGDFPEHIHGYDSTEYYNPLFIELIGDYAVNVYREEEQEETASDLASDPFAEVAETVSKMTSDMILAFLENWHKHSIINPSKQKKAWRVSELFESLGEKHGILEKMYEIGI